MHVLEAVPYHACPYYAMLALPPAPLLPEPLLLLQLLLLLPPPMLLAGYGAAVEKMLPGQGPEWPGGAFFFPPQNNLRCCKRVVPDSGMSSIQDCWIQTWHHVSVT